MTEGVRWVRLACGHERVSRGWRGAQGERYCCDVCHVLTVIEEVRPTELEPCDWRPRRVLMRQPPSAGAVPPVAGLSAWRLSDYAVTGVFDPVENAKAGLRYIQERYGAHREWRAFRTRLYGAWAAGSPWPLSSAPSSPHGDPMASLISQR